MALLSCPECGAKVSSHAPACPGCGAPQMTEADWRDWKRDAAVWVLRPFVSLARLGFRIAFFALGCAIIFGLLAGYWKGLQSH